MVLCGFLLLANDVVFFLGRGGAVFKIYFVHVAQLSIALGRHTLPHVRE